MDWSNKPRVLSVRRRWAGWPLLEISSTPWDSLLQLSTNLSLLSSNQPTAGVSLRGRHATWRQPPDATILCIYNVELEKYLQQIDSFLLRCSLTRFRFGQHWLQCHRGRFHGLPYEREYAMRVCSM